MTERNPAQASDTAKRGLRKSVRTSEIKEARLQIDANDVLRIEFQIDELVRKLLPEGSVAASCSGCDACSGCSM